MEGQTVPGSTQGQPGSSGFWGMISHIPGRLLGVLVLIAFAFVFVVSLIAVVRGQYVKVGPIEVGARTTASEPAIKTYVVTGKVVTSDDEPPYDVQVALQFPLQLVNTNGTLQGVKVWRGPDGRLPCIGFLSTVYRAEPIDLNLATINEDGANGAKIEINDVKLRRLP